jgi:hypothetical protein
MMIERTSQERLLCSDSERRTAFREEKLFPVRYRLGTDQDSYRKSQAIDLSTTGVRLEWEEKVLRGARVSLNLSPEPLCNLNVTGSVVWSRPTWKEGVFEVGVRFERVTPADQNWLNRRLKTKK